MSVYFFYGDEDFLIERELKGYRSKLDKNFSSMNYNVYDNPGFPDLINALRTQSMMFGKLMIVIYCEKILASSFEDSQIKEISQSLEMNNDNVDLFFVARYPRNEGKKPDSRKKLCKILLKYTTKTFSTIRVYSNNSSELSAWITGEAKKYKITLDSSSVSIMIEQIGNNLRELSSELEKLSVYAYPETKITPNMVSEICISNQDIFNFIENATQEDHGKALLELKRLLDKKHPLEILSASQTTIRKWIMLKLYSKEKSIPEIAKIVGNKDFWVKQTLQKLKNKSLKNLVDLKERLFEAECKIKMGKTLDPYMEVENAISR